MTLALALLPHGFPLQAIAFALRTHGEGMADDNMPGEHRNTSYLADNVTLGKCKPTRCMSGPKGVAVDGDRDACVCAVVRVGGGGCARG